MATKKPVKQTSLSAATARRRATENKKKYYSKATEDARKAAGIRK
jgi:hypothetical protein